MPYVCPACSSVSNHPEDERHGYCGRCHNWTGDCGIGRRLTVKDAGAGGALVEHWGTPCPRKAERAWVFLTDDGERARIGACGDHLAVLDMMTQGQIGYLPYWLSETVA